MADLFAAPRQMDTHRAALPNQASAETLSTATWSSGALKLQSSGALKLLWRSKMKSFSAALFAATNYVKVKYFLLKYIRLLIRMYTCSF
jgi:hypothetical protein